MKKRIISTLSLLTITLTLAGCGGETTYTEEFDYLPQTKDMKVEEHKEATEDQMGTATYKIEDTTSEEVMDDYHKKLKKDGWEITEDNRPILLKAEKGEHKVTVVPTQSDKDVILTVVSK